MIAISIDGGRRLCPVLSSVRSNASVYNRPSMKLRTLVMSVLLAHASLLAQPLSALAAQSQTVTGVVRDSSGGGIPGAVVIARSGSRAEPQAVTGSDGQFSLDAPAGDVVLIVRAGGFAEYQQRITTTGPITV